MDVIPDCLQFFKFLVRFCLSNPSLFFKVLDLREAGSLQTFLFVFASEKKQFGRNGCRIHEVTNLLEFRKIWCANTSESFYANEKSVRRDDVF